MKFKPVYSTLFTLLLLFFTLIVSLIVWSSKILLDCPLSFTKKEDLFGGSVEEGMGVCLVV